MTHRKANWQNLNLYWARVYHRKLGLLFDTSWTRARSQLEVNLKANDSLKPRWDQARIQPNYKYIPNGLKDSKISVKVVHKIK
jgi:hypothetical protein